MRIAAITDIHALAAPFERALAAARADGFDTLVVMGDLLTYGVEPQRTLDAASEAAATDGAIFLIGNHDALYRDLAHGERAYYDRLPGWLKETVDWTAAHADLTQLEALPWQDEWQHGDLLVAHANPFGARDWTYLTDDSALARACETLAERGLRHGVFGHSHRARAHDDGTASVTTLPALGQPRDRDDRRPQWSVIEVCDRLSIESRPVPFDADAHCAAIGATTMSPATKERLCSYFH
ncbi:metallophosphoesterase family protein [Aurantiacibacter spongiae]|uniref:metallophosphoesterase family protein n=1 Tax=Aurantiacibacter spongiae TaxID=2488860 RepID=UPI00131520F0|nr:metallophosphoesterase [Aurantiacibacter spongiae]